MKKLIIYVLLLAFGKTFAQDTKVTITGGAIGGGSGNNIYNIDSSLSSDRTVDLNGKVLVFSEGGNSLLSIHPSFHESKLYAIDGTAASYIDLVAIDGGDRTFDLNTHQDAVTVDILGNATANTIDYTAATQTITASTLFHVTDGVVQLVSVDVSNRVSFMRATDGTADAILSLDGNSGGTPAFSLDVTDGTNQVNITGSPGANTLTYTAATHTFNGSIIYNTPVGGTSTDSVLTRDASTGIVNMRDVTKLVTLQNAYDQFLATWDFINPAINGHNQPLEFDSLGEFFVRVYNGPAGTTLSDINMDGNSAAFANQGLNGGSSFSVGDTTLRMVAALNGNVVGTTTLTTPHYFKIYQGNSGNTDDSIARFIIHIDSTATIDNNSVVYFNANHDMLRGHLDLTTLPYVAKTANYTVTSADYTINCTSNSFTVTFPTAIGISGRVYVVKNSGAGTITLAGNSGQTFDGAASPTISAGASLTLQSNNAAWIIL